MVVYCGEGGGIVLGGHILKISWKENELMKKACLMGVTVLLFALVFGQHGSAADKILEKGAILNGQRYAPGEIIVKFKPEVSDKLIAEVNSKHGTSVLYSSRFADFKRLRIPKRKAVEDMVEIYKRNPNVEYAELNYIAHAFVVPNDPYYSYQWNFYNTTYGGINMESAWGIETGDASVIVAVVDTGVAYENYSEIIRRRTYNYYLAPDLAQTHFVAGYDFVNNDAHPNDDDGHGTHVTGTIAQSTNNAMGVAGIAYGCSIMPVKVLNSQGSGTYADIAEGIYFAADNGAKVINMSLGGSSGSTTLENALAHAYGKGVTIVCASGNNGSPTTVSYPAAYDAYCIAVGATRYDEAVSYYSNGGASLDLAAPGGDLNVDQNGDGYGDGVLQQTFGNTTNDWGYWFYEGTSMAAPHVSGVAALLIAHGVATTPDEVREALQSTAEDKGASGWDSEYGWGIVDAYAALNFTPAGNNPPVADAGGPYTGTEDIVVAFDGSSSYDPDGDTLTYRWDFGDGSTGAGVNPSHVYTAGGEYTVTLVVNDGKADSGADTATATIVEVPDAPVADAGPDQTAWVGDTVTFDGSGSYDIDDGIAAYDWDFGDGQTGSGETVTHVYSSAGKHTVTLTVTDNGGLSDTDEAIVTVTEKPKLVMHVANIAMSTRKIGQNVNAVATVTVVDAGGAPVAGAAVGGHWSELTSDVDSGLTNATGKVSLSSNKVKNARGRFTFTVDNITKDGWSYNSAANVETTDSITVP